MPPETDISRITAFIEAWNVGYSQIAGTVNVDPLALMWAGSLIEHELMPRIGNPAVPWLDQRYIERVQEWTERYRI